MNNSNSEEKIRAHMALVSEYAIVVMDDYARGFAPGVKQKQARAAVEASARALAAIPAPSWIPVTERLPEWVSRDDTPCEINGTAIPPTLFSATVLVSLKGGGVRTDKLTTIEGKSDGWWHTFGERVVAWQPTPDPYMEKKNG